MNSHMNIFDTILNKINNNKLDEAKLIINILKNSINQYANDTITNNRCSSGFKNDFIIKRDFAKKILESNINLDFVSCESLIWKQYSNKYVGSLNLNFDVELYNIITQLHNDGTQYYKLFFVDEFLNLGLSLDDVKNSAYIHLGKILKGLKNET